MKPIVLTEERMQQILPQNIKDTDVISADAKKVLAAIMNYFLTLDKVKEQGSVHLSNTLLRQSAHIKQGYMLTAIQELKEHDLIKREVGKVWTEGEEKTASIYKVMWHNLVKPLKKLTFDDLFSDYLESSETPMGTTVSDTVTVSVTDTDIVSDSVSISETDSKTETESVEVKETGTTSITNTMLGEIGKNKFQLLEEYIEECYKDVNTYQDSVSQIGLIHKWIKDRYSSKSNVESLTSFANGLINKKLEVYKTVSH